MALLLLEVSDDVGKDGAVADVGLALDLRRYGIPPRIVQWQHSQSFDSECEIRSTAKPERKTLGELGSLLSSGVGIECSNSNNAAIPHIPLL